MNWKLLNRVWHANLGMASAVTLGIIALSCPFIAHKGGGGFGKALMEIHYGKFLAPDLRWIWIDGQGFLLAFLIGSGLLMHRKSVKKAASTAADDPAVPGSSVTLLDFGESGIALAAEGEQRGLRLFRCPAGGMDKLALQQERWLIVLAGSGGFTEGDVQAVQALVAKEKKGSLKRLQVAVAAAEGAEAMQQALLAGGAAMLAIPAVGDFQKAVLDHLCEQSDVLKKSKRAAAARVVAARPVAAAAGGFTLVEVLASLVLVGLLIGGASGALERMTRADQVRSAAQDFQALLVEARELARRENSYVRVALLPEGMESAWLNKGDPAEPRMGACLRVLRRPALDAVGAATVAATSGFEVRGLQEMGAVEPVEYPAALRGGWDFVAGAERWRLWPARVHLVYPAVLGGRESPWVIKAGGEADLEGDLSLTPVRKSRELHCAPVAASDSVALGTALRVSAGEIWGGQPVTQWRELPGVEAGEVLAPAIDFHPSGRLVNQGETGNLKFEFSTRDGDASQKLVVRLDAASGQSWIE